VWFEPEPNHSRLEPIDIKNPISKEITAPEYNFNFNVENTETIQESGNYRKTTITFEGSQPGLNGIIKAKQVDNLLVALQEGLTRIITSKKSIKQMHDSKLFLLVKMSSNTYWYEL